MYKLIPFLALCLQLFSLTSCGDIKLWPDGRIPTQLSPGISIREMRRLACAVKFFDDHTCLRFVRKTKEDEDYLHIATNDDRPGCFTEHLGVTGGRNTVNLDTSSLQCWRLGTIVHQLLHAVGVMHEQAREDRDNYIKIHWENIPPQWHNQYKKASELGLGDQNVGSYDYASVMHYGQFLYDEDKPTMSATKEPIDENNELMGNRKAPTEMDAYKVNLMYNCTGHLEEPSDPHALLLDDCGNL